MTYIVQEITLGVPSMPDGPGKTTTREFPVFEDLKILVRSVSNEQTEVILAKRAGNDKNVNSQRRKSQEGGWRITMSLIISLPFTHGSIVKLLLSTVASRLKSGYDLLGNYIYEDVVPLESGKRKFGSNPLKGQTQVQEVAQHFHLPINEASKLLNICPTVLKKICRKAGLPRWPHRKLQSIQRELGKLRALLNDDTQTEEQIQGLEGRISHLEKERRIICFQY